MLETDDKTVGYKRRFFCIPFDRQFEVNAKVKAELDEGLASPNELSGLVNRILPRLPITMEEGLQYNEAARAKVDNYVPIPAWFKKWFTDWVIVDHEARIPTNEVYDFYSFSIGPYKPSDVFIDRASLVTYLRAMVPGLICNKPAGINGKTTRCYFGIMLKKDGRDRAPQITEIIDFIEVTEEQELTE